MKPVALLLSLLFFQFALAQKTEDFTWLEGTWERINLKPGSTAYESWKVTNQSLHGLGVRLKGTDTVFTEKLKLIETDRGMSYVAEVAHNNSAVYFKIIDYDKHSFISENPSHDFPKRITYQLEGDELTVIISGDGKSIPFVFQKTH